VARVVGEFPNAVRVDWAALGRDNPHYFVSDGIHLNTAGTWKVERYPDGYELERRPDGGGGGTPEAYHLALVDTNTTARIEVHRDGGYVRLDYVLKTEEPVRNP
jgi:hypothetical protein